MDDLQRLTPSQATLLYRLVELGYLAQTQVDDLLNRLSGERYAKAVAYLEFGRQLDADAPLHQPHIISRCYYAMYHAARALTLHVRRADVDDHERLPLAITQALGTHYGEILGRWREIRNRVEYSPYGPDDMDQLAKAALEDADALLAACRVELQRRGARL